MISQPVSITNELIDQINAILSKGHKASALDFQLLKRQARSLISKDACRAYSIFGMIATLEDNPKEMRGNHRKTLKLALHDNFTLINYNTSLRDMGFFSEALQQSKSMLQTMPKAPYMLNLVIDNAVGACRFKEAFHKFNPCNNSLQRL